MSKKIKKSPFNFNKKSIAQYITTINSTQKFMKDVKKDLYKSINDFTKFGQSVQESFASYEDENLNKLRDSISNLQANVAQVSGKLSEKIPELLKSIARANNGILTTRMIEPLNISRHYIALLEHNKELEKIARGVYTLTDTITDDFFVFQQKYSKAIFSHMTALYLHQMTEEIPYKYTVTVPNNYHNQSLNQDCKVFFTNDKIYNLGACQIKTPNGNLVVAYNTERCICDIIKNQSKLDFEQVKKSIKQYAQRKDKDLVRLSKYAQEMGIKNKVMEVISYYYD